MGRKKIRKEIMITIYQMEITNTYDFDKYSKILEEKISDVSGLEYANNIIAEFLNNKDMVDEQIEANLKNWHMNRLPKIDLAILRLATTEFFYDSEIPIEVSVNEAIELSKEFSDEQSAKFINGVLGGIISKGNLI